MAIKKTFDKERTQKFEGESRCRPPREDYDRRPKNAREWETWTQDLDNEDDQNSYLGTTVIA